MKTCATKILPALVLTALLASPASAQPLSETIDSMQRRVVKIFGAGGLRGLYSYSTGFLVSPDGHVVTVWSHVLDDENFAVVLHDGRQFSGKVLGAEPQLDLAVIKLETEIGDLPHFDLEKAAAAAPGTRILGFSNMFKVAVGDEPVSVLHGVVAAHTKLRARRGAFEIPYDGAVYIVDAITNNPGAGGGVITTWDGKLLGMIGKQLRNTESNTWINYAIPIPELKDVIQQIISGDYTKRDNQSDEEDFPNRYTPLDFGLVLVPDVLYRTPAYIDSVIPGSPADAAGLRPDDLIMFVNDQLIQSHRVLRSQLGRLEAGDSLRLIVRRGDELVAKELAVEKKPND